MTNFLNKPVWVYYNLHKKTFSIKYKNRVVGYANYLRLENVKFVVRNSGRLLVLKTKQKNVHAFVCGTLLEYSLDLKNNLDYMDTIKYNPYVYETFVLNSNKKPIIHAESVILNNDSYKIYLKH